MSAKARRAGWTISDSFLSAVSGSGDQPESKPDAGLGEVITKPLQVFDLVGWCNMSLHVHYV